MRSRSSAKENFFALLRFFSGKPDSLKLDKLKKHFSTRFGTSPHTVDQWIKEQGGLVRTIKGLLHIEPDGLFGTHSSRGKRLPTQESGITTSIRPRRSYPGKLTNRHDKKR